MNQKKIRGTVSIEFDDSSKPKMQITNIHPDKMVSLIEEFVKMGFFTLRDVTPLLSKINVALKKEPEEYLLKDFVGAVL